MSVTHYQRIQHRITTELGDGGASNWLAAAWGFAGIGASTLLSRLAIPSGATGLPAWLGPALVTATVAAVVLTATCAMGHQSAASERRRRAQDIIDEMNLHSGTAGAGQAGAAP